MEKSGLYTRTNLCKPIFSEIRLKSTTRIRPRKLGRTLGRSPQLGRTSADRFHGGEFSYP